MPTGGLGVIIMDRSAFKKIFFPRSKKFKNLANSSSQGSILITAAVLLPILIMLAGLITDIGRALSFKAEINKACMIAAEEASKEIDISIAQETGQNFLHERYGDIVNEFFFLNIQKKDNFSIERLDFQIPGPSSDPKYIVVSCTASIDCFFLRFIGIETVSINSRGYGRLKRIT